MSTTSVIVWHRWSRSTVLSLVLVLVIAGMALLPSLSTTTRAAVSPCTQASAARIDAINAAADGTPSPSQVVCDPRQVR